MSKRKSICKIFIPIMALFMIAVFGGHYAGKALYKHNTTINEKFNEQDTKIADCYAQLDKMYEDVKVLIVEYNADKITKAEFNERMTAMEKSIELEIKQMAVRFYEQNTRLANDLRDLQRKYDELRNFAGKLAKAPMSQQELFDLTLRPSVRISVFAENKAADGKVSMRQVSTGSGTIVYSEPDANGDIQTYILTCSHLIDGITDSPTKQKLGSLEIETFDFFG